MIVGMVNREREVIVYRIEIAISGENVSEVGPRRLEPEETWEQPVAFTPIKVGPRPEGRIPAL